MKNHNAPNTRHCALALLLASQLLANAAFAAAGATPVAGQAAPASSVQAPPMTLVVNKSGILRLDTPAKRISVGNPDVADITPINTREIYVVGKSIGSTNLIIWNKIGTTTMIDVNVIAEPVRAKPAPIVEDKDTVEVIKGLNKTRTEF